MKKERILSLLIVLLCVHGLQAQYRNQVSLDYIDRFSGTAMEHMKAYRIPASITLAQGILESGAGKSDLAVKANNHFGIKCGGDWRGRSVRKSDDAPNECFRAYKNASESYLDHSKVLTGRPRYATLFKLDLMDYKGWAHGLKAAGYATNPSYATRLITIIENYELYRFDSEAMKGKKRTSARSSKPERSPEPFRAADHQVFLSNDLAYVCARQGDSFELLAKEFKISARKLRKYNELHKGYTLVEGDIVYLRAKRDRSKKYKTHVVRDGDSMHTISQLYGIKMKPLYRMNRLDPKEYMPRVGDVLKLR